MWNVASTCGLIKGQVEAENSHPRPTAVFLPTGLGGAALHRGQGTLGARTQLLSHPQDFPQRCSLASPAPGVPSGVSPSPLLQVGRSRLTPAAAFSECEN